MYRAIAEGNTMDDSSTFHRKHFNIRKKILLSLTKHSDFNSKFRNEKNENLLNIFVSKHLIKSDENAVEIAKILIDFGVLVDEADSCGNTPLINSIKIKHNQLVSFLIDKGADVNHRNHLGKSPLSMAIHDKDIHLIDLLLSSGAHVNTQDENKWTALHEACRRHDEDRIRFYISKGANLAIEDDNGRTPLLLLIEERKNEKNQECINIMIRELAYMMCDAKPMSVKDYSSMKSEIYSLTYLNLAYDELQQMKGMKIYESYTYYSIVEMSKDIKKLADIVKNEEFVLKFEENLDSCLFYKDDLRKILSRAKELN